MVSSSSGRRPRISGVVGMASAVLWLVALTIEYRYDLQPPGDGSLLYFADSFMFFLALAGYLIMLLGLWQAKATGEGAFGRGSLGIFIVGLVLLLIAQIVSWLTRNHDNFLFPLGGLCQLVGVVLTGIAVVTAKRWDGWQRYVLLLQAVWYVVLVIPLFVAEVVIPVVATNQGPTQLGESLWQVTWFITSLALFTQSRKT